jgi:protein-tyrosine-phosphatase
VIQPNSAGSHALVDEPMLQQSRAAAVAWGVNPQRAAGHRARQLSAALIADTQRVITLARAHRAEAVRAPPTTNRLTVNLREAARLLGCVGRLRRRHRALPTVKALLQLVTLGLAERGATRGNDDAADVKIIDPPVSATREFRAQLSSDCWCDAPRRSGPQPFGGALVTTEQTQHLDLSGSPDSPNI